MARPIQSAVFSARRMQSQEPRNYPGEREQVTHGSRPTPAPDTLLIRSVLDGDAEAVDGFVSRMKCVPRILNSLNARLGKPLDEHELFDLGQDVLVVIWRKLPSFDGILRPGHRRGAPGPPAAPG